MIEAIREIGLYALKKEGKSTDEPLGILCAQEANYNSNSRGKQC
jgi:hypothetical protein